MAVLAHVCMDAKHAMCAGCAASTDESPGALCLTESVCIWGFDQGLLGVWKIVEAEESSWIIMCDLLGMAFAGYYCCHSIVHVRFMERETPVMLSLTCSCSCACACGLGIGVKVSLRENPPKADAGI